MKKAFKISKDSQQSKGIDDVPKTVELNDRNMAELILRNVLCVSNYKVNLLSVNKAINFGHRFIFNDSKARVVLNDSREISLTENTGLFLKVTYQNGVSPFSCNETKRTKGDINLWATKQNRCKTHCWLRRRPKRYM